MPFLVLQYIAEEERAGCFTLFVSLRSHGCLCSVPFPRVAVDWSVVCDCVYLGRNARKPVFGVSGKVILKPVSSPTETS